MKKILASLTVASFLMTGAAMAQAPAAATPAAAATKAPKHAKGHKKGGQATPAATATT